MLVSKRARFPGGVVYRLLEDRKSEYCYENIVEQPKNHEPITACFGSASHVLTLYERPAKT